MAKWESELTASERRTLAKKRERHASLSDDLRKHTLLLKVRCEARARRKAEKQAK